MTTADGGADAEAVEGGGGGGGGVPVLPEIDLSPSLSADLTVKPEHHHQPPLLNPHLACLPRPSRALLYEGGNNRG